MSILDIEPTAFSDDTIVPGRGSLSAPITIVGEAPGADEVRLRQPFIGRSGTLLKKILFQAGIPLSDVYMTNVVKVRPKGNDIKPFFNKGTFSKEGQKWLEMLKNELEKSESNVIVALGGTALAALCGLQSITKWRGSILESSLLPGRKVIPSIHPSAALRQYIQRFFINHDIRRALEQSEFPDIRRPERNLIINPSADVAMTWMEEHLDQATDICLDIEISGQLELSCIGFSVDSSEALCIPVAQYSLEDEARVMKKIGLYINEPRYNIIGQNVIFDLMFLLNRYGIIPSNNIDDTMVAQSVLFPDFPKGLDFLNSVYTEEPYYKDEGKEWKKVRNWRQFWEYNAKDATTTLEIWNVLEAKLKHESYWDTYRRDMRKHEACLFMSHRGMYTDPEGIEKTKAEVTEKIKDAQIRLDAEIAPIMKNKTKVIVDKESGQDGYLNVNSPVQLKKYFYGDLGIAPYLDKKRPTCNDKALQRLAKGTTVRAGRPEAKIIQELVGLKKFRGTYLNMKFDEDGRFRADYRPRGTIFGRLSSAITIFHTGMNMQNLPPQFKGFLKADPGYILFEMDKVQAEWVATAYIAGDQNMISTIESGQDPHAVTAKLITRISVEAIQAEHKYLGHASDPIEIENLRVEFLTKNSQYFNEFKNASFLPRTMSCRQCGKKSNHGFNYGMQFRKFSLINETTEPEAKIIYTLYHRAYPGLANWYERVKITLNKDGRVLQNCYGRKVRLLDAWGDSLFQQAYSFYPQSTVADLVTDAMINSLEDESSIMQPFELLGQVHDSLVFQYPISEGFEKMTDAIYNIKKYMEPTLTYAGRDFVIATDMKFGLDWGSMVEDKLDSKTETRNNIRRLHDTARVSG